MRLHQALQRAGRAADAQAMASAWLQAHPRDMLFLFHLGDEALRRQDWPAAEARYRQVLGINPAHALSLNNVAWLLLQQKQPGALALARRAVQVAPDQAALRDTLAQALAEVGQLPEAVGMQKQALALQPDDPNLRLRLARLYAQVNEKKLAKAFRGAEFLYTLRLDSGQTVLSLVPSHHNHAIGERIGIRLQVDHVVAYKREGEPVLDCG